jgi:hypothetical protein
MDDGTIATCTPRYLPSSQWKASFENAIRINGENRPADLEEDVEPAYEDERLAVSIGRYWGKQGVKLTVGFMDTNDVALRSRILSHLNAWNLTANVTFVESSVDPQVRIARRTHAEAPGQGGYWSYLGTDILLIPKHQPTMNLQAFTTNTADSEFHRVVRHEAGHTLGFPHEHMRAEIVRRLDREKVIADFMASQGWSRQKVIDQILTPLEESSLLGTPQTDDTSIMCYQIAGNLTLDGKPVPGGTDINASDRAFVAQIYPKPA